MNNLKKERIAWADARQAIREIVKRRDRYQRHGGQDSLMRADGLEMALEEIYDAFMHIHVRSDDGDKCSLCDLDIRSDIHGRGQKNANDHS